MITISARIDKEIAEEIERMVKKKGVDRPRIILTARPLLLTVINLNPIICN